MSIFISLIDPLGVGRKYLWKPLREAISVALCHYRDRSKDGLTTAKELFIRTGVIAFATAVIIWAAIFMYIAFYYTYMPTISHTRPVHVQFEPCHQLDSKAECSYPHAHISLTKRQNLLMVGQSYKISLTIEMPESPRNQDLGMFMVCAEMRHKSSLLRGHSCRSAILRYKSPIIRTLSTILFSPMFVFDFREEKQLVPIEFFTDYVDDQSSPVTDVYLEIQSQVIQFYSVTLHITAHFTGLRYIMFHWPILSASVGISTNLFFIMIVSVLSWYHWASDPLWQQSNYETRPRNRRRAHHELSKLSNRIDDLDTDSSDEDPINFSIIDDGIDDFGGDVNFSEHRESTENLKELVKAGNPQQKDVEDC